MLSISPNSVSVNVLSLKVAFISVPIERLALIVNLNTLVTAKNSYQTLNDSDARALIYQKYLLSESVSTKTEYLFMLEELFKKSDLSNIYSKFLSDKIEEIGIKNLPKEYQEIAVTKIISLYFLFG